MRAKLWLAIWLIGLLFPLAWLGRFSTAYRRVFNALFGPEWMHVGMHFALETFYGEEDDGARIESQLIVTEDGHKVITKWPCEELMVLDPR